MTTWKCTACEYPCMIHRDSVFKPTCGCIYSLDLKANGVKTADWKKVEE
jgi:hypothetical protein